MKVLRTPEERFDSLTDYPFESKYVEIPNQWGPRLRIHYVDQGEPGAPVVVMLHGEPTWSFEYRSLIPPFVRSGFRVLAPDLVGFGRSDKPARIEDYTYERMVDWMAAWFDAVDPRGVTLVVHGWGGLIGLRVLTRNVRRFARVIAINTGLPTGKQQMSAEFATWQLMARNMPVLPIGNVINGACFVDLKQEVVAGYDAPFPDESYKSGARALPLLIPLHPDDPSGAENRAAWKSLRRFKKPFMTAFSYMDPMSAGTEDLFKNAVPGAIGQPHTRLRQAGHFVTEDRPDRLVKVIGKFLRS